MPAQEEQSPQKHGELCGSLGTLDLCEVSYPQVDRAQAKGSRRSRRQRNHTDEETHRRMPLENRGNNMKQPTKQTTSQPHRGTDQRPTPTGAECEQERAKAPHPPAQGSKAPMASRNKGEQENQPWTRDQMDFLNMRRPSLDIDNINGPVGDHPPKTR